MQVKLSKLIYFGIICFFVATSTGVGSAEEALIGSYDTAGNAVDVDVSGHYAYVADQINGLVILDISNPSLPALVGSYNTGTYTYGVAVSGDYAYVTDDENGLLIVDVSNPSSPVLMGSYYNANYWGARHVTISGHYAYVTYITGGLVILDISNPSLPTFVESILTHVIEHMVLLYQAIMPT